MLRSPKDSHKPVRLALPHPLLDPRNNPVCLLVKDPQREYKDLLAEKKIKFISRVVGMEKLQGKVCVDFCHMLICNLNSG